jgi:hypothetical protein
MSIDPNVDYFIKGLCMIENTTLVALIAALASLLGVIINTRNASKSSKELEKLKNSLALDRKTIEEKNRRNSEYLIALSDAVKSIQRIKDDIQRIVSAYKDSQLSEELINAMSDSTEAMVGYYEEHVAHIGSINGNRAKELFHNAKRLAFAVDNYVKLILSQNKYASDITLHEKEKLKNIRRKFSDIQTQLQTILNDEFINK